MIHNVVTSIGYRLDEFIKNRLSISDDTVIISSLVDVKGNLNQDIENKVAVFLLHIEEEKVSKNGYSLSSPGMPPPVMISIYLMFSAYFPNFNYIESLRYISLVIEFFQSNNVFTGGNTSTLSGNIDKITVEISDISIDDINKLWGNIGANYIPSVAYKVKYIRFDGQSITDDIPSILGG